MQQEATKAIESLWDSGILRIIGAAVVLLFIMFKNEIKNAIFNRTGKGKNGATVLNSSARMAFQVGEIHKKLEEIAPKINNLEEWHDVDFPDQPGVKIWWYNKELNENIKRLTKAIEEFKK